MVIAAAAAEESRRPVDRMAVEKPQSRLHNFSFPSLSWGNQRLLRCVKLDEGGGGGDIAGSSPATLKPSSSSSSPEKSPEDESSPASPAGRPWNLRTRRSACYAPKDIGSKSSSSPSRSLPPQPDKNCLAKSLRLRSEGMDKGEPCKFSISLSREEIEEDFLLMKGTKPPRRPKKRAKIVQRQLDSLLPGLFLSEITPDSYKIED